MDTSNLVKIQEESFVDQTDPHLKKEDMLLFYNNDSEQANLTIFKSEKSELSPEEIVQQIQTYLDIRTTNMSDILEFARSSTIFSITNWEDFRRAVIKRKKNLKRIHAKRKNKGKQIKTEYLEPTEIINCLQVQEDDQLQIKKKRNRMSAQISRDRKKQHIKQLEKNCQQYRKQAQEIRAENQKLKKQLENQSKSNSNSSITKNKFISLLILLGIFFLISMVKDVFRPNHDSSTFLSINSNKQTILTTEEQSDMIEKGKEFLSEIEDFEEQSLAEEPKIKNAVLLKLNKMEQESQPVSMPPKIFSKLLTIRKELF